MGHRVAECQVKQSTCAFCGAREHLTHQCPIAPLPTRTSIIGPLGETTSLTAWILTPQRRGILIQTPPILAPALPWEPQPSHHLLTPTLPTLPQPPLHLPLPTLPAPHPSHPNLPPFHTYPFHLLPPNLPHPLLFPKAHPQPGFHPLCPTHPPPLGSPRGSPWGGRGLVSPRDLSNHWNPTSFQIRTRWKPTSVVQKFWMT